MPVFRCMDFYRVSRIPSGGYMIPAVNCLTGKELQRRTYHSLRHTIEYMAQKKDRRIYMLKARCA